METAKKHQIKSSALGLAISFVLMLMLSLFNWGVVSGWGNVKIKRLYMTGDDGLQYSALMYTPKNARDDNQVPAVLMVHGGAGNARNHESWAVEFSRRGFIVLSVDHNGAGESESYKDKGNPDKSENNAGKKVPDYWNNEQTIPEAWLKYLLNVPMVDQNRVIAAGHSMGCPAAARLAEKYQLAGSILASGPRAATVNFTGEYHGATLLTSGTSDLQDNEHILDFMSTGARILGFVGEGENIEYGKLYGSYESGNCFLGLRIEKQVHEFAFASTKAIGAFVDFAQNIMDVPNHIAPANQIWFYKDILGQLGMYAFAASLVFLYLFVIDSVPAFNGLKQKRPKNIGLRKQGMVIAILITIAAPLICMKTATFGLLNVLTNSGLFNMGHPTKPLTIVLGSSLFGLLMLFLFWKTDAKKHQATLYDLGIASEATGKVSAKMIGKALLLAVMVIAVGWTYLALQTKVLGTDFYCLFWGYKPIDFNKFPQYLPYIVLWTLCFIVTSIGINVEKRLPESGKEWLDTLTAIVFNVVVSIASVVFILWLQNYLQISANGALNGQAMVDWKIDITRLYGMPAGMSIGIAGNTYLYRKTGSIWPGTFLMGIMCSLSAVLYGTYGIAL